ncbi:MAG: hypothetical protein U5K51_11865 [Flavobacteriaceae bacterium]|nr:hypothetical protein [Flavobacteriaceae bacterium]
MFLLFGLFLMIEKCDPIYFNKPQPDAVKNLKQFPKAYRGTFMDQDSTYLVIDKTTLISRHKLEWKLTRSALDTSTTYLLDKNFLINKLTNEKSPVQFRHDTIFVFQQNTDTLFVFSDGQVARSHQGNLILNHRQEDNLWEVEIFSLKENTLTHMAFFNTKDIFTELAALTDSEVVKDSSQTDTLKLILKPSKKEFKKMLAYRDSLLVGEYIKINPVK